MEGFRSTDMLSCRDNGWGPPRCVLPAPRPPRSPSLYLPLSRNTRHILPETTPPAKSSLPAPRLFSFAPTLFPSRALTAHLTVKRTGTLQRLREPFKSLHCLTLSSWKPFLKRAGTEGSCRYLCSPLLHRFRVTVKTLVKTCACCFNDGAGKRRFLFELVGGSEGLRNSHGRHPSVLALETRTRICLQPIISPRSSATVLKT